jgi:hypothetical protein
MQFSVRQWPSRNRLIMDRHGQNERKLVSVGTRPYLHRASNGPIILSHRLPGTSMKISVDEAVTWGENIMIDDVHGAYPSILNLADGSVLVVYYEEGKGSGNSCQKVSPRRCKNCMAAPVKYLVFIYLKDSYKTPRLHFS